MNNPFEQTDATYLVLINEEEQYSLWPSIITVPEGWSVVVDRDTREVCIDYINSHWTDMRPRSLQNMMDTISVECK